MCQLGCVWNENEYKYEHSASRPQLLTAVLLINDRHITSINSTDAIMSHQQLLCVYLSCELSILFCSFGQCHIRWILHLFYQFTPCDLERTRSVMQLGKVCSPKRSTISSPPFSYAFILYLFMVYHFKGSCYSLVPYIHFVFSTA